MEPFLAMGFNTNELRIGNLVDITNRSGEVHLPHNTVLKIGQIQFFKVHLYEPDKPFAIQPTHLEVDASDLCPIPLTEDWLVDICYEIVPGYDYGFKQFIHKICRSSKDSNWWRLYNRWGNAIGDQIQYVHQLQNLFFALYGTELELNRALAKKSLKDFTAFTMKYKTFTHLKLFKPACCVTVALMWVGQEMTLHIRSVCACGRSAKV